jgi:hypothetical protein
MNEPKRYVLLKDTPIDKAGGIWRESVTPFASHYYKEHPTDPDKVGDWQFYAAKYVENNPTWFKPLEDDEITKAKELLIRAGYFVSDVPVAGTERWGAMVASLRPSNIKYTVDDLRKAFHAARYEDQSYTEIAKRWGGSLPKRYPGFYDYLKHLNK